MNSNPGQNRAIIAAAGAGSRMGGDVLKPFIDIDGKPVLLRTLEKFQSIANIHGITVILPQRSFSSYEQQVKAWNLEKIDNIVAGGENRQASVWKALLTLPPTTAVVLIHDGVRPFIRAELIEHSIKMTGNFEAVVLGVTPRDTIKTIDCNRIVDTHERDRLVCVQTPQTFSYSAIMAAYKAAQHRGVIATDDAALVERLGKRVYLIKGDYYNIKLTLPEDIITAKAFLRNGVVR